MLFFILQKCKLLDGLFKQILRLTAVFQAAPPGTTKCGAVLAEFWTAGVWAAAALCRLKLDVGSTPGGCRLSDASALLCIDLKS